MQRGKSRCKRMQADASDKARREGEGSRGKGQGGRCPRQKAQKEKALAVSAWSHVVACVLAPRLFCAFGSVAPPCPFCPSSLPPAPLLLRLHSACIPLALRLLFPFAFRFHSAFIPLSILCRSGRVGWSGRWVWAGRVVGSGRWVGSVGLPFPLPIALRLAPLPPFSPPPRGGGLNNLRLQLWQAATAYQSSDLRSRSALIRLFRYLPLLGKVLSQYSFSWSSLNDIIF